MNADRALAAAIRAAAMADASVKQLLGDPPRFYDDPAPDAIFPYVTLGRVESRAVDASESAALEHLVTLHAWSRHGGRAETLDIIGALRNALHDAPIEAPGRTLVFLFAQFADVFRSGDGRTTHGLLRLRALTEPQ